MGEYSTTDIKAKQKSFQNAPEALLPCLYSAHLHIHAAIGEEAHSLRFQQAALDFRAAEGVAGRCV